MTTQTIIPHLWFDRQAEEAAAFYAFIFGEPSRILDRTHYSDAGQEIHGMKAGTLMSVDFELCGVRFVAINGGPHFQITPAISFHVTCESKSEIEELWNKLAEDGEVMMPLDSYEWADSYGWVKDRFGMTWQLMLGALEDVHGQKIIPSLMFVSETGQTEEAIEHYTAVFKKSSVTGIHRYGPNEDQPEGTVMHAQFQLMDGEVFMAMDSSPEHADFTFNEAVSLMVECDTQEEIDTYWEHLSAVPEVEQCGWLKDKFGVSWQIVPKGMNEMFNAEDPEKAKRAMNAMLKMKKLNIQKLDDAFEGFLSRLSSPARNALLHYLEVDTVEKLSQYTEKEILALHGMGKASMPILREALEENGLSFREET